MLALRRASLSKIKGVPRTPLCCVTVVGVSRWWSRHIDIDQAILMIRILMIRILMIRILMIRILMICIPMIRIA